MAKRKQTGSIYKRTGSPFWWAKYRDTSGKLRRVSLKTRIKREAEAALNKLVAAPAPAEKASAASAAPDSLFMGYAIKRFLPAHEARTAPETHKYVRGCFERLLLPEFAECQLDEISPEMVEAWLYKRMETQRHNTVRKEFATLKQILNQAVRDEAIPVNRAALVKMPKSQDESTRTALTREEFQRIIAECSEKYAAVFTLVFNTGMRKTEFRQITYAEHLKDGALHLTRAVTKTYEPRMIPLNDAAAEAIETLRKYSDGVHIVPPCSDPVYYDAIRRAADKAGFKFEDRRIGLHTLRHSFATLLANNPDIPLTATQKLLGHKSLNQTGKYVHESPAAMVDAVSSL